MIRDASDDSLIQSARNVQILLHYGDKIGDAQPVPLPGDLLSDNEAVQGHGVLTRITQICVLPLD